MTSTPTVSLTFRLSILQHKTQTNSLNWCFVQLKQATILDKFNLQLFQMVSTGDEQVPGRIEIAALLT